MPRLGLRLTPHGRLSAEDQDDGPEIDAAASIRLIDVRIPGEVARHSGMISPTIPI
jgi:hypothetical protein